MVLMMTDTKYSEVKLALDAARYTYKLADWESYFEMMNDQDVYYDVADKVKHLMTPKERALYQCGDLPKWLTDCFDKYELENFGTDHTNHI